MSGGVLTCDVALSLWFERFAPLALLLAIAALAALLYGTGWWRKRRVAAATLVLDVLVIFAFLWSLDEREHVVIRVGNGQYIGEMGTAVLRLGEPVSGNRFGLYAGALDEYRVSPLGEVRMTDPTNPLGRFGEWLRLSLTPAWSNLRIVSGGGTHTISLRAAAMRGQWKENRRGEYAGSLSSSVLLGTAPPGPYTIEGDLMRGDGTQGIIVGVGSTYHGYLLQARADVSDVQWVSWNAGLPGTGFGGHAGAFPLEAMVQRDMRLVLVNGLWAMVLLLLSLPLYVLLTWGFRLLGGSAEDELRPLEALLERRGEMLALAACVALTATVLTALVAWSLLERIPHVQDSVADLFQAKTLALGRLWVPQPRLPAFFTEEFIPMYHGKWFGKYPPGWPLLLTLGVLAHAPWLVDPILSGVIVLLIFLIGRELFGPAVGLLAALLTVSSPFFLFLGGSFMPHTSTACLLLSAAYLFMRWYCRAREEGRWRGDAAYLLPAGFLLGMGFITRQTDTIAFALPFTALLLPSLRRWRLQPVLWLALGALPPVAGLLLYNHVLTGSALTSPYSLWWPFDRIGFGPKVGFSGFTPAQGLWNTSLNLQMLLAHLFGWPFYFTLGLAALPFLTGRARRWDWLLLASAAAIVLAYAAYWNPGVMYGPRYYFAALPWLALLSARGIEALYQWPLQLRLPWRHDRIAALAIPAACLALLLAYNLTVYMPEQIPLYRGYNYTSAAAIRAVQRAGIHHAVIFVVSTPANEWWTYGAVFSSNSPLLDGDIVYARDFGVADRELMLLYPGRAYYRLSGTTLKSLSA